MNAYVKSVVENNEVIKFDRNYFYKKARYDTCDVLEAESLNIEEIENISDLEHKLYEYMKNQDIELLTSEQKYTTSLVNYGFYKAINLETYLLKKDKALERLFSLSHEIGHFLDAKFNHYNDDIGFNNCYEKNMETMELVAWSYAWKVLEALGCTYKYEFMALASECLDSYTENKTKTAYGLMNMDEIVKNYEEVTKKIYNK